ncbi:helix-turn-helix domain-containing protein [Emticicia agri]|uniref:DNA-binding protein n=1 Tax=Emticicia agri TaxID=2492393 RepID=A0A4Q5LX76_9BACT|nr:helix-turn-helix domain-containing protein [Emticicia agri]RYU94342.1 DNA-binding protein [Emticicia agri]
MDQNIIVTSPQELQKLIYSAVSHAVQQISIPQKVDPLPEFLTIEQASEFLNLAKPTLYSLVSRREIPFLKRSKKLYFLKEDIINWLKVKKNED